MSEKSAEERRALPERGQIGSGVQDKISSSATFMRQLPRRRLPEGIGWVCPDMDPSMTHALSNAVLLAWCSCALACPRQHESTTPVPWCDGVNVVSLIQSYFCVFFVYVV